MHGVETKLISPFPPKQSRSPRAETVLKPRSSFRSCNRPFHPRVELSTAALQAASRSKNRKQTEEGGYAERGTTRCTCGTKSTVNSEGKRAVLHFFFFSFSFFSAWIDRLIEAAWKRAFSESLCELRPFRSPRVYRLWGNLDG